VALGPITVWGLRSTIIGERGHWRGCGDVMSMEDMHPRVALALSAMGHDRIRMRWDWTGTVSWAMISEV
jgi:hypothetical protein